VATKVLTRSANEKTTVFTEAALGAMAMVTAGADLVAGSGILNAVQAAREATDSAGVFAVVSGQSMRYNTGSHVDMKSYSILSGLSWGWNLPPGRMTLGAFFEYGNGSYDTYNSFASTGTLKGNGDSYYIGGGILGRKDFVDTGPGNFYGEFSARAGKVHNDYTSDIHDYDGKQIGFKADSTYYSGHLGTGYVWKPMEDLSLDVHGKYFWTHVEGDKSKLTNYARSRLELNATDSHRARVGARLTYSFNDYVSPYIGAAYEHEFDGKSRGRLDGDEIPSKATLKGDTGIGELGLNLSPSREIPLFIDMGVQGYIGKREGVTGSLKVRFEF
jgi:outer membrane autotransporter protein